MKALVLGDGSASFALVAVRSLARAGWTVDVADPAGAGRAAASRYVTAVHVVPRPEEGLEPFVLALQAAHRRGRHDVVLACDDAEVVALTLVRDRVDAVVPHPPHETLVRALDKLELTRAAAAHGLAAPRTAEADEAGLAAVTGPVVVKARLHWSPEQLPAHRHSEAVLCDGPEQARAAAARMRAAGAVPLVQERVAGDLRAVSLVLDRDGRLLAAAHQRATRLTARGTSARAVTVPADAELEQRLLALLAGWGWWGLANLQLLAAPGRPPLLIDLNPRLYGSLALAVAAGADLPALWAAAAVGTAPAGVQRARPGVRFQALEQELVALRAAGLSARGLLDTGHAALRSRHSTWSAADPAPAARQLLRRLRPGRT